MDVLDSLGEDLVLLSVSPADGRVTTAQQLGFGLIKTVRGEGYQLTA